MRRYSIESYLSMKRDEKVVEDDKMRKMSKIKVMKKMSKIK
jgi:uncharacterized membrane protein